MTMLEMLWRGELSIPDIVLPTSDDYRCALQQEEKCEKRLREVLAEQDRPVLEHYQRVAYTVKHLEAQEAFVLGFQLGAQLAAEALNGKAFHR